MTHPCRTCPAPITGIKVYCDACREARRTAAWKAQAQERKSAYAEIEIDAIPYVIGRPEREDWIDLDWRAVDMAVSRYLVREGVRG